ncbi:MAG TPA: VOC family protein, partial [Acidimicrobiales bacterium]
MVVFADPVGAVLGLWQPGTHTGAQLANEPNTYCWSELVTTDLERSKEFYKAVFGWDAQDQGSGEDFVYVEWKLGDRSMGGMMPKSPEMPAEMPPVWGVYFAVADADATAAKAQELGGAVFMGPQDIEPGRMAVMADDQGVMFQILALKE